MHRLPDVCSEHVQEKGLQESRRSRMGAEVARDVPGGQGWGSGLGEG